MHNFKALLFEPASNLGLTREQKQKIIRNNSLIASINFICSTLPLLQYEMGNMSKKDFILLFSFDLACLLLNLCLCRRNPKISLLIYFLKSFALGPLSLLTDGSLFFFTVFCSILQPIMALFLTESVWASIFTTGVNVIYCLTLYSEKMLGTLESLGKDSFVKNLLGFYAFTLIVNAYLMRSLAANVKSCQLEVARKEMQHVNDEKQKIFMFGFSHEIRNLINTIIGNLQLCLIKPVPKELKDYLNNAKVCGDILIHLVNNILDGGKAEIGELEIEAKTINIHASLIEIWQACSVHIERKGLTPYLEISKSLPTYIECDPFRLAQIIFNLVSNARKFTQSGSIGMIVSWIPEKSQVDEDCFEGNPFDDDGVYLKSRSFNVLTRKYYKPESLNRSFIQVDSTTERCGVLRLDVIDSGCGIEEDKIPRLFSKFAQVSDDQSKRQIGTGLGLYITKELCHKMKGDIRPYSMKGKGTAFITCIPCQVNSKSSTELGKPSVLVVDNDVSSQMAVSKNLKEAGISDIEVVNCEQMALDKYQLLCELDKRPSLVIINQNEMGFNSNTIVNFIRKYENTTNSARSIVAVLRKKPYSESTFDRFNSNAKYFIGIPSASDIKEMIMRNQK